MTASGAPVGRVFGVARDAHGTGVPVEPPLVRGKAEPCTWADLADSLVSWPMANTQGPEGNYDPAGSTQMFRAFVDESPRADSSSRRRLPPVPVWV